MNIKKQLLGILALGALISMTSCSSDDEIKPGGEGGTEVTSKFVVAATSGENDYLVKGDELSATTIFDATTSSAIQVAGSRSWNFYGNKVLYGFLYNQADAGTTASYILNSDGIVTQRNELALAHSIQTRGISNEKLVWAYSDRMRNPEVDQYAHIYVIDPETDASTVHSVVTSNLLEEGEAAYLTDITEFNGLTIAGARSISSSAFDSEYFNNTYVIVFNSDFSVRQVIKDSGRTGFVAGQFLSQGDTGLEVVDNGDLYVFSSGQTNYANAETMTIPSGILKVNNGQFDFDDNYFFNITQASGGHNLYRTYYMGGSTFVLSMYPGTNQNATFGVAADRFAVIDVASQSFTWVSGFPTPAGGENDTFSIGAPFIDSVKNRLVVPMTTSSNQHYLYAINPTNASATQLSKVTAEGVKAVGILAAE